MKLAYVGLDNSHADHLIGVCNVNRPEGLPEAHFTHIWGRDPQRAATLQQKWKVPTIAESPEAILGKVDAVVVGARHGGRHLAEARPFLEKGMTVFIDKPFTDTLADAEAILDLAKRHGARVTSFSSLRMTPEVMKFRDDYAAITAERYGGAISGHGDETNPYGGWYFYAVHSVELVLECFAPVTEQAGPTGQVLATKIGRQMHVRFDLDDGQIVSFQLSPAWPPFSLIGYADHAIVSTVVPLGASPIENTRRILNFLHGAPDLTPRQLLAPLKVMETIRRSLASGRSERFEV